MRFHAVTKSPLYNLSMKSSYILSDQYLFFADFSALKTCFEVSRVKLSRNDLRGNKNYFELAGGSS